MKKILLVLASLVFFSNLHAQYKPGAGLIDPYSNNASLSFSGQGNGDVANVVDRLYDTQWGSANPFPSNYTSREDQNYFLNKDSILTFSSVSNPENIVDGSNSPSIFVDTANGSAWVKASVPDSAANIIFTSFRAKIDSAGDAVDSIEVFGFTSEEDSTKLGAFYTSDSYGYKGFFPEVDSQYTAIKLQADSVFTIYEWAAIKELPKEYLTMDLGAPEPVQVISFQHASDEVEQIRLLVSKDSTNWRVADTVTAKNHRTVFESVDSIQYIRAEFTLPLLNSNRAWVREVTVFGRNGEFGPLPEARAADRPLAEQLGINGIWSWGTGDYSTLDSGQGPVLYSQIASYARNQHNWHWDVANPDSIPDYEAMANGHDTLAQKWLNWNQEYEIWKDAGFEIQSSIQYRFRADEFDDPYQAAYNYGNAFASHFGPDSSNLVSTVEIGNEPWTMADSVYKLILNGMARGLKDADENIKVAPAALQAYNPQPGATGPYENYMGNKIDSSALPYLDILNIHAQSLKTVEGTRTGTYPEDPVSSFNQINNAIKWRDTNMAGKPVYLTQWGWDIDSPEEPCTHSECVSAEAGADYAVRGLMKAIRSGVDKAFWYYFHNNDSVSSFLTRTGLTNSDSTNFKKKRVFYAFQQMLNVLGDKYFLGIEQENENAWIYKFGNDSNEVTHLIGWRPIAEENEAQKEIVLHDKDYTIENVYRLDGDSARPTAIDPFPRDSSGNITLTLESTPVVMETASIVLANENKKEDETHHANAHPNPFTQAITITLPVRADYQVYNISGKIIDQGRLEKGRQQIGNNWSRGFYILQLNGRNLSETLKLIKH